MSITFFAEAPADRVRTFRLTCEILGVLGEWTGAANAYGEADAHALVCTGDLCSQYGADVDEITDEPAPVNVCNNNGAQLLAALGYVDDEGSDDAEGFLGRVLLALAIMPTDEGMPVYAIASNIIDCGRPAGYLEARLAELRQLATECAACGVAVAWS
jgi:hypothetical protein